ncbi:MAG: tetratricopeptide repeat protein [Clostridiales bacterium]|jgi:tetratricopeptide (TPR) repeat protein|nr:tetratricopeptide repeat protein [Clostridiales bacterium]
MKRVAVKFATLALALTIFAACAAPARELTAAELLDLGEKYLLELNYEQAIVQFTKLIEIEPKNPRGYTGLAEAHIGLGDTGKAIEALRQGLEQLPDNAEIAAMLAGLSEPETAPEPESTSVPPAAEPTPNADLLQGEYITTSELMRYKLYLVDGIPQPMGTSEVSNINGTITETIMAYMSHRQSAEDDWSEWEVAPHYWAGLRCTDCGETPSDGSMPKWFQDGFSHPWSGEWDGAPRVHRQTAITDGGNLE